MAGARCCAAREQPRAGPPGRETGQRQSEVSPAKGRCCYVDARGRRPLLAERERAGLLDARTERCAGANRRDDDWAGVLDRRNDGTEKNGASGSAQPSSSHGELAVRREKSGGERKEASSPRRRGTPATGRGTPATGTRRAGARRGSGGGSWRNRSDAGEKTRRRAIETACRLFGEDVQRLRAEKSESWRVGPLSRQRRARNRCADVRWAWARMQAAAAASTRSCAQGRVRAELGRAPWRVGLAARLAGLAGVAGLLAHGELGWHGWAACARGGRGAGAMGARAVGRAAGGGGGAVGRGGKRGKGGRLGRPRWAREERWAEIYFSFSFLFLSLFYLFQFDTMRKQMIK
jgi:hypothetical protein